MISKKELQAIEHKLSDCASDLDAADWADSFGVILCHEIERARADNEALKAEVKRLEVNGIHTCHDECPRIACALGRDRDAWKQRAERLAETVRFYAHPDNYATYQQYRDLRGRAHDALSDYRASIEGEGNHE